MPAPSASKHAFRRPVLIIQFDEFNRSRINTIVAAAITSNSKLGMAPGNVTLTEKSIELNRESVINVSQLITLDRSFLNDSGG